jgi:Cys-tRNA(Pro)/Cys-tRNA(Cys) deacylase
MSTRAIQFLNRLGLAFDVIHYDHLHKGAEFASRATGFPLERTVKSLVVEAGAGRYSLVLVPGDRQLDMKRLARALAVKRADMADPATAERLTGYRVGGISPFGARQALPVVMDAAILEWGEIVINAGRRGVMLKMAPADIRSALNCLVAPVCEEEKG